MNTQRNVFVTGAASGIGEATARMFAGQGWSVMLNARREDRLRELLRELPGRGHHICAGDYSRQATMDQASGLIDSAWDGRLHAVVNCAGVCGQVSLLDTPLEEWHRMFDMMVNGGLLTTRLGARHMKPGGKIVHVTSIHWNHAEAGGSAYSMAKAALAQMVRAGAVELAPLGININAVAPGFVKTPMSVTADGQDETEGDWFRINYVEGHQMPARRPGRAEEVARVCCFLAGEGADYMTGETVHVDGGLTITF